MSDVNLPPEPLPSFEQMISGPGGEPRDLPGDMSADLAQLEGLYSEFASDSVITAQEKAWLEGAIQLMSFPNLDRPDQDLINAFSANLTALQATNPAPPGGVHIPIGNAWLTCSAAVALFIMTLDIVNILSQIKQQEADLQIALTHLKIAMAEQIAELTVQLGQIAHDLAMNEATECWIEMGAALASLAVTASVTLARQGAIRRERMQEHPDINSVMNQYAPYIQMPESFITALKSGLMAGAKIEKADLKLLEAELSGVKEKLQPLMDIISNEIRLLSESRTEVGKQIKEFLEALHNLLRTVGEQFSRG